MGSVSENHTHVKPMTSKGAICGHYLMLDILASDNSLRKCVLVVHKTSMREESSLSFLNISIGGAHLQKAPRGAR